MLFNIGSPNLVL